MSKSKFVYLILIFLGIQLDIWAQATDSIKLVILHTNDTHSRLESYPNDHSFRSGASGYARRAALIQDIRKKEKNVLLLDAGDFFQGTPYFNFFKGVPEVSLMSRMKYDAVTLGNHEFDNGMEALSKALKKAGFQIIESNLSLENSPLKKLTHPYCVIKKSSLKIGIIGIFVDPNGLIAPQNTLGMIYLPPLKSAQENINILKKQLHCDMIICLSHLGHSYSDPKTMSDSLLAASTHGLDLIIGGHTHKLISKDWMVKDLDGHSVRIVQTGSNGVNLGKLEYYFIKKHKP